MFNSPSNFPSCFTQQDKPVINKTASSQNVYAWPGATTNLSCVADGNPAPRYIWTNSSGIVATSEENGILRVTPQDRGGFGPYTCTVENNKGKDSLDIQLVRVGKFRCTGINFAQLMTIRWFTVRSSLSERLYAHALPWVVNLMHFN